MNGCFSFTMDISKTTIAGLRKKSSTVCITESFEINLYRDYLGGLLGAITPAKNS